MTREKQIKKTTYTPLTDRESVIKLPELKGQEILVINLYDDKLERGNDYSWDKKTGVLVLFIEDGLHKEETLDIQSFSPGSDPEEEREELED